MYRYTRKNEISKQELDEILEVYAIDDEVVLHRIVWVSATREQLRYGNKSHWSIQYRFDEASEWDEIADLETCTECGEVYPVSIGNIYDIDECEYCKAQTY